MSEFLSTSSNDPVAESGVSGFPRVRAEAPAAFPGTSPLARSEDREEALRRLAMRAFAASVGHPAAA